MSTESKAIQVLKRTVEILADPKAWIKEYIALDQNFKSCNATDKKACKWCLEGAFFKAACDLKFIDGLDIHAKEWERLIEDIESLTTPFLEDFAGRHITFNDHKDTTHEDIMTLLNNSIKKAETQNG